MVKFCRIYVIVDKIPSGIMCTHYTMARSDRSFQPARRKDKVTRSIDCRAVMECPLLACIVALSWFYRMLVRAAVTPQPKLIIPVDTIKRICISDRGLMSAQISVHELQLPRLMLPVMHGSAGVSVFMHQKSTTILLD
jgi:hypothetical protein